jgi:hypothetical protein
MLTIWEGVSGLSRTLNDVRLLLDGKPPFPEDAVSAIVGGDARKLWFEA